ncbi:hypothetical protein RN001_008943 [Aquatica leii]|uniref:Protein kinase C-binding protein 1 n=1 Tax=Aquatica leii TaxID=1421715 RepID=A0AAN7PA94_9COLE|nr:hypothetical protein RN001_008943 [Aquatica leii]
MKPENFDVNLSLIIIHAATFIMSTEQEPHLNSTPTETNNEENDDPKVLVEYVVPTTEQYIQPEIPTVTTEETPESTPDLVSEASVLNEEDNEVKTIAEDITKEDEQEVETPKRNRELKLLLALSKEANLNTNIVHKRKSVEPITRTDSVNKRRNSTGSQDDLNASKNDSSEVHEDLTMIIGINPKDIEISNSDVEAKETKEKEKDGSINKHKKMIGGAVDENGRRNRKLSNSYINMNNEWKDPFCWQCHHEDSNLFCKSCPRSFHQKCLKQIVTQPNHWMCPECAKIMQAENLKQRSSAMQDMTLIHLCVLLKYALKRMLQVGGCEPFIHPVNDEDFPDYKSYIVHPMDLTCLEKNIKKNVYGSPQAFEADAKWILHNSIIFNSYQSKLTSVAKSLLKICKQEMNEIENCSTCYLNANTKKKTWFVEVCPKPHVLVWAKLKGFPFWPAKAMRTNQGGLVDVRFFGAHDRAWIHHKECFLFSLKDPNSNKQKKNDIIQSVKELELHVENLKKVYGEFRYAPYRVQYEPEHQMKQLQMMLPNYPNKLKMRKPLNKTKTNGTASSNDDKTKQSDTELETNESDLDEDMNQSLAVHKTKLINSSSNEENDNSTTNDSDTSESRSPFNRNVRETSVRMRGGFTNISGKLKILPKLGTQDYEKRKRHSTEDLHVPNKLIRRNSDQSDISLHSNTSDQVNKVSVTENMEVTVKKKADVSENDTSKSNSETTPEPKQNSAIQVGLKENPEITISPKSKSKISDRLIKKFSEPDNSSGSKPVDNENKDKEVDTSTNTHDSVTTDLYLNKLNTKDLTVLEKVTELSSDTNIFDHPETSNDSKDFVQDVDNMGDYDQLLCTEEIELDDKDNILLNFEQTLTEPPTNGNSDSNITNKNLEQDSSVTQPDLPSSDGNNLDESNQPQQSNKDSVVTSINTEEAMDTETNTAQTDQEETPTRTENSIENSDSFNNDQNADKIIEKVVSNSSEESTHDGNNRHIEKLLSSNVIELTSLQRNKVTIVNVDDIRKKNLDKPTPTNPSVTAKSILENRLNSRRPSNQSEKDSAEGESLVVIKSEPSSEDEPSDTEYLEKKRKYLSALNISEKMPKKIKPNEIRTRSKTEDRKFKVVDNISKVIDDVASHYSLTHANEEVTITRTSKKKEIFVKPLPTLQDLKPRARKSFPTIKNVYPSQKKDTVKLCKSVTTPIISVKSLPNIIASKPSEVSSSNNIVMITQTPPLNTISLLPPNQQINYTTNVAKPLFTMVQHPNGSTVGSLFLQPTPVSIASVFASTLESQNFIPQSGSSSKSINVTTTRTSSFPTSTNNIVTTMPSMVPLPVTSSTFNSELQSNNVVDEVQSLSGSIPELLTRSINDIMCRTPPVLKPRPPGPLSTQFNEGLPSTAGSVTSKVNSISHRLTDYFRGMLIELLKDIGTSGTPEAEITKLKLENEELKHRHAEEILEIKKNISSVLKDMQKSLTDEKNRVVEETRTACELETVKRVEEAKSKQWCANCSKEAQFYCCWNTSYCDYPCQQKHWPAHMSKCTQQIQSTQLQCTSAGTSKTTNPQPLVLRQTTPPKGFKTTTILGKSTKVLLNRPAISKVPISFARTTTGSHITLVESTPGNYELVGNGGPISVGGKFITKIKSASVLSVTSAANSNVNANLASVQKTIPAQSPSRTTNTTTDGKNDGI